MVTTEFHGLFKNGGIGTANTGLALALAAGGCQVYVAIVDGFIPNTIEREDEFAAARKRFGDVGVMLERVPWHPLFRQGADDLSMSYSVYGFLRDRDFDLVLFNECGGQGYHSLNAKHLGLFPNAPAMYVVTHGPSEWVDELNAELTRGPRNIAVGFLERRCVELADVLISPSQYLLDWMGARGWSLPKTARVIQNVLPPIAPHEAGPAAPIEEIVFFGRLEVRKGLELFCDAITALQRERSPLGVDITLMGKFNRIGGVHSGVYVLERSRGWARGPRIIAGFDQAEAMNYLARPGVLAVIPSIAENSPCVVAECLQAGVRFVATSSGGTAELVAAEDRAVCLTPVDAEALKARLGAILDHGHQPGRLAIPQSRTSEAWLELVRAAPAHRRALEEARVAGKPRRAPKVSFCVTEDANAKPDRTVLSSVLDQVYPDFEIVIARHGARDVGHEDSPQDRASVRRFDLPSGDRTEARNFAAAQASGEFLFFVAETDVILNPDCLAVFVDIALRLGADAVTGVPLEFERRGAPIPDWDGRLDYIPIGANIELAAFQDCLGHSAFLIRAETFKTIGGFSDAPSQTLQDRLLLTKALLAGAALEVATEPLYWRRVHPSSLSPNWLGQRAVLDLYRDEKVSRLSRVIESIPSPASDLGVAGVRALQGLPAEARELALSLAFQIPLGAKESYAPFVKYCLTRSRYREAVEFARFADPEKLLASASEAARAAASRAALDATRGQSAADRMSMNLAGDLVERLRAVSSPGPLELERGDFGVASHALNLGMTALKAPSVCPPHAATIEVVAGLITPGSRGVEFSFAVCEPDARLDFVDGALSPGSAAWWSGWFDAPADGDWVTARLDVAKPCDQALDLFLFCRTGESLSMAPRFAWRSVRADVLVAEYSTPSRLSLRTHEAPLTDRILGRAEVLSDTSDFPWAVFALGPPLLHHPLAGRNCVVRIKGAVFPGAIGVRAEFALEHAKSHPVAFAFWIRPSTEAPSEDVPEEGAEGFSGWSLVERPFEHHQARAVLRAAVEESCDLYLATRVVGFPDVFYSHASWKQIVIVEPILVDG